MLKMYKTIIHSFILYFWLKFFQLSSKWLTKYSHHFLNDGCGLKVTTIYYEGAYSRLDFGWGTVDNSNTWRITRPFTLSVAGHGIRVFPAAVPNPTLAWMLHRNKNLTWSCCSCCWLSLAISLIFTHLLKHIIYSHREKSFQTVPFPSTKFICRPLITCDSIDFIIRQLCLTVGMELYEYKVKGTKAVKCQAKALLPTINTPWPSLHTTLI